MGDGSSSGVYYRPEDYLGVAKRLLIDLVDLPVAAALSFLTFHVFRGLVPGLGDTGGDELLLILGPWFAYFVLLKRSRFRTLGYVVAGARIVDMTGGRPSILRLSARLLFALAGPMNVVFDVLWLGGERDRQAFRDKFAGTYVIRQDAIPAGTGTVVLSTYMFSGMTFLFREVARRSEAPQPSSLPEPAVVESGAPAAAPAQRPRRRWVSVTLLLCGICTLLFVGIQARGAGQSWDTLATWGYPPAERVWDGAYWGLVSSAFVHLALWHLAFNVYWLWVLGGAVERELGSLRYVGFVLLTAVATSAVQLAASGATGHGASGVVYGLFGLMWASQKRLPGFARTLGTQTVPLFVVWLVGCILATAAGIAEIGNAAHVSGLVLGLVAAHWLVPGMAFRSLAVAGTGVLAVLSLVPLFWSPWSSGWVAHRAYRAHLAGDYGTAIAGYHRSLDLGGDRVWTLGNLALAYHSSGSERECDAAIAELREASAEAADEIEAEVHGPAGGGEETPPH